jgi:hypothetical protein
MQYRRMMILFQSLAMPLVGKVLLRQALVDRPSMVQTLLLDELTPAAGILTIALVIGASSITGCAGPVKHRTTLPSQHRVDRTPLLFHSDFPLASQHRLLEDLTMRRADVTHCLGIPTSNEPIHVYLFEDAERFNSFVGRHHPDFPARRAFFLETDTRLVVYAQWGDRVAEDLRHEVTHAYVHAVVPNLPLWLDEGLAEYYEVPRGARGLNMAHLHHLLSRMENGPWVPDLTRLEHLPQDSDMTLDDYAEAWAWVHFLVESHPGHRTLLHGYLQDLRVYGWAEPISARLSRRLATPELVLPAYIQQLSAVVRR